MDSRTILQSTIETFWDTIPPTWKKVRANLHTIARDDFGISELQFHFLRHINHGINTAAALAARQQVSRPAATQTINQLVEKALVTRTQNQDDRRFVNLTLTTEGANTLSLIFAKSRLWMSEKMKTLNEGDLQTIFESMSILKQVFTTIK